MSMPLLTLAIYLISVLGGLLGSLLGMGGGTFIVPILVLAFGLDIRYAVGASMISVIATSSGTAVSYIRQHLTNLRIGILLALGAALGALSGAYLAGIVSTTWLFLLFGLLLLYSALAMLGARRTELPEGVVPDALSSRLRLEGSYYDRALGRGVYYRAARALPGLLVMYLAGTIAGLLGIGAGAFKVLAMDQVMRLPMKVSTATSSFMIGITAATSAAVYFARGQVEPTITAPVALGVLTGAILGTRVMARLRSRTLRMIFVPVLLWVAGQMIWKGWTTL